MLASENACSVPLHGQFNTDTQINFGQHWYKGFLELLESLATKTSSESQLSLAVNIVNL